MMTLLSTLLGFASGGLPKVLDYFQDRGDKKHELALMSMQREREIALAKEGYIAQARVGEIKTDQIEMQTQAQERVAMYKHDMKIGDGASTWVINLRASVRPIVTYVFVGLPHHRDVSAQVYPPKHYDFFPVLALFVLAKHFGFKPFSVCKHRFFHSSISFIFSLIIFPQILHS